MHWLDILLLVLLVISIIRGISSGFIQQAINLSSVVGAFILANPFSNFLLDVIAKHEPNLSCSWVGWLISFLVLVVLIRLLANFLLSGIAPLLGPLNKLLGAALSFVVTALLLSIVINFYVNIGKKYEWAPIPEGLLVYPIINEIGKTILPEQLFIKCNNEDSKEEVYI